MRYWPTFAGVFLITSAGVLVAIPVVVPAWVAVVALVAGMVALGDGVASAASDAEVRNLARRVAALEDEPAEGGDF